MNINHTQKNVSRNKPMGMLIPKHMENKAIQLDIIVKDHPETQLPPNQITNPNRQ